MKPQPSNDLVVVGGGPIGLATAIRARQEGLSVVLLDARRPPIDKACGEGLMPDGRRLLERLGVKLPAAASQRFHGIRYVDGGVVTEANFGGEYGLGVRRVALHKALVSQAVQAGVDLRWGVAVCGVDVDDEHRVIVHTRQGDVAASWAVAADGLRSPMRTWVGLDHSSNDRAGRHGNERRFGKRWHVEVAPWTDRVEVYWHDHCEAYVTPVGPRAVGVALLSRGTSPELEQFPELAHQLAGHPTITRPRGAGPLDQRVRDVVSGRVALVGDASGYLDAITGEGLSVGLHQAFAAVEAMCGGNLAEYRAKHREIVALPNLMIRLLLFAERRPALRRRVIRALAADRDLFGQVLAVHARQAGLRSIHAAKTFRFALRLLLPVPATTVAASRVSGRPRISESP